MGKKIGPPPVIGVCPGCRFSFVSKYQRKRHVCPRPIKEG